MNQVFGRWGGRRAGAIGVTSALTLAIGCGAGAPNDGAMLVPIQRRVPCSQMHRAVSRWQRNEVPECGCRSRWPPGADPGGQSSATDAATVFVALRSVAGDPRRLDWRHRPRRWAVVEEGRTAGFTLLPTNPPRILSYDPRSPDWSLYLFTPDGLVSPQVGSWPQGSVFASGRGQPWGRQFIGLEDGHLLDRNPGDGSARMWRFVPVPGSDGTVRLSCAQISRQRPAMPSCEGTAW